MVSNYSLAGVTVGETPCKQGNVPPPLSQPQEGKIINGLIPSQAGHPQQETRVLGVPQDQVWFVIKHKTGTPGGRFLVHNWSDLSRWEFCNMSYFA